MAVEITMRQECPAYSNNERDPIALALLKPVAVFEGQMTIRIHEADGTPYEHVLDLRTNFKRYEVPFNTKYKRVRRNTKRFLARQAAAAAAAQGHPPAPKGPHPHGGGLEDAPDDAVPHPHGFSEEQVRDFLKAGGLVNCGFDRFNAMIFGNEVEMFAAYGTKPAEGGHA